jgi:hypothetical protein
VTLIPSGPVSISNAPRIGLVGRLGTRADALRHRGGEGVAANNELHPGKLTPVFRATLATPTLRSLRKTATASPCGSVETSKNRSRSATVVANVSELTTMCQTTLTEFFPASIIRHYDPP